MDGHSNDREEYGDRSARGFAASQQTGEELPQTLTGGRGTGTDLDDPSYSDTDDPDHTDPLNSAAGPSVGGTGAGIEPGVTAGYGMGAGEDSTAADIDNDAVADTDFDPGTDPLGMTDGPDRMITGDTPRGEG